MNYDSTWRGPLKRNKKGSTKQTPAGVSGSRDLENGIEDDGKLLKTYLFPPTCDTCLYYTACCERVFFLNRVCYQEKAPGG